MKPVVFLQRVSNSSEGRGGGGGGGSEGAEGGEGTGGSGGAAVARSRFDMSISEMERYEVSDIRRFLRWANYNMTDALQVNKTSKCRRFCRTQWSYERSPCEYISCCFLFMCRLPLLRARVSSGRFTIFDYVRALKCFRFREFLAADSLSLTTYER